MFINQNVLEYEAYAIVSPDGKLIAKGTGKDKCIYHVEDEGSPRVITYRSKAIAEASVLRRAGNFHISTRAQEHLKEHFQGQFEYNKHLFWSNVRHLFEARQFLITYTLID